MSLLWQQIVIGVLLIGAIAYLVYYLTRRRRHKGCPGCSLNKLSQPVSDRTQTDPGQSSR
ncbi:FeoB-associated Cys-rich membrane protein [bacterium]|nr:FeoB-associated Cys-rich membrane protein [bacterium]